QVPDDQRDEGEHGADGDRPTEPVMPDLSREEHARHGTEPSRPSGHHADGAGPDASMPRQSFTRARSPGGMLCSRHFRAMMIRSSAWKSYTCRQSRHSSRWCWISARAESLNEASRYG